MKVFERNMNFDKVNFVDENNVFVGYDYKNSCCEDFFYIFLKEVPKKNDRLKREMSIDFDTSEYNFDTSFFKQLEYKATFFGGACVFRLEHKENKNDDVYLVLVNYHNGYYEHGFHMKKDEKTIKKGFI